MREAEALPDVPEPRSARGRIRTVISGVEIREAPATADTGRGVAIGAERFDADDVVELRAELLLWLSENWPERGAP